MARTHQRRTRRPAVHPPRTPAPSPHPRRCPSPPRQVPAHRRRNPALPDRQEDHPPRVPAHPRHAAASCTSRHQRHRAVARPRGHLLIKQIPARGHGSQRTHPRTHHARRGDRSVSADRRHAGLPRQPHRAIANYPEPTAKAAHRTTTSRSPIGMTRISAQAGLWRSRHNTAERAIRRPVVTRKNAYGSRNDAAARLAARVWTETATETAPPEYGSRRPLACPITGLPNTYFSMACRQRSCQAAGGDALDELAGFRRDLYRCLWRRADALFETMDAVLTAGLVPSLPYLSL